MNTFPLIVPILLLSAAVVHAQDAANPTLRESDQASRRSSTPQIIGEIPDGSPLPPAPPRKAYHISERDVLATTTHQQGGRTITMRQINPNNLQLPPARAQPTTRKTDTELRQHAAEYQEENPESKVLRLSATVYRFKDSPTRTLLRYWLGDGHEEISLWTSADFALIAGEINAFEDTNGVIHHLHMGWGIVEINRIADLRNSGEQGYATQHIPDFAEGIASFRIIGKQTDTEALAPIHALHEIYNNEFARLKTAYEGRERARIEREEYLNANPPLPQDITLNFWRTEKPAPTRKGGDK